MRSSWAGGRCIIQRLSYIAEIREKSLSRHEYFLVRINDRGYSERRTIHGPQRATGLLSRWTFRRRPALATGFSAKVKFSQLRFDGFLPIDLVVESLDVDFVFYLRLWIRPFPCGPTYIAVSCDDKWGITATTSALESRWAVLADPGHSKEKRAHVPASLTLSEPSPQPHLLGSTLLGGLLARNYPSRLRHNSQPRLHSHRKHLFRLLGIQCR